MKNGKLQKIQENNMTVINHFSDDVFAEIFVQGTRCLLKIDANAQPKLCEACIVCQTENEANICKDELARFIRTSDSNNLNWYIGMDYNDVNTFFSGKELRFFHYKEALSAIDDVAEKINAQFPTDSDLLIYVEGTYAGLDIFDRLHFSRWIQFSYNEAIAPEIKVSVWHNAAGKADCAFWRA